MFIRNCWYVAAWSNEIAESSLFARTICGVPVVFWRDESGTVQALVDRCCHRGAPLSCGRREANGVRCMYHGFKFDRSGRCVEIPGQDRIPAAAFVRSFAVIERHRWVWIWMGNPEHAEPSIIPDTHWLDDPGWTCTPPGYIRYEANYRLLNDNLLDFSHLSFVHPSTLGGSEEYAQLRSKVDRRERSLHITRWFMDRPPAPFVRTLVGHAGNVDRWNNYEFFIPGVLVMDSGFAPAGSGAEKGDRSQAIEFRHCQAVTPETDGTTHYFFSQPRRFEPDNQDVTRLLHESILSAFEEDRVIITAQEKNLKRFDDFRMLPCSLDAAPTQFRWMLDQAIRAESRESLPDEVHLDANRGH
ncbi:MULTISPECIES: aromatic ring-hydroxylating dioxygenase subunit alpha [Paraburkholderia]|uniref:aromatic ring-hydroxylating dioxygenase subunit alpha n=1 Tax=Paraburkholderia TaxID=1822464 RepID=UPI002AB6E4A2|nr:MULTISPECIES: aromatic ring-hydroxylating dioxygenase subunit alpha [Paraburkholderia]